jgi:hypothetical protein
MDFYPSRKTKNRKISMKNKKRFILIANFWMSYLILLSILFIPNSSTYSNFNDTERIENQLTALDDFCSDKEYKKNNKEVCKDNSGLGNGPEPGDDGEYGDPDNPGKGNDDKKDCLPEECVDDHPNNNDPKDKKKDEHKDLEGDTNGHENPVTDPASDSETVVEEVTEEEVIEPDKNSNSGETEPKNTEEENGKEAPNNNEESTNE